MERRSWPWKKRASEKVTTATATVNEFGARQNIPKKVKYVQIKEEDYVHQNEHITELEEEIRTLNNKLLSTEEKLLAANSENTAKENLVKQHTKVAEEAVSGWEKAEAETLALRNQLDSISLLKQKAEDRASHLDGALKECMRQIRNVKEESEHKLQEVVLAKTKKWEDAKLELENTIAHLDKDILMKSAENNALSRSLHEHSNVIMKLNEEKVQAEGQIQILKNEIESHEKEIDTLKYEVHVVSKELEIRNEERDMSLRSAEAADKQHSDDVKKIAKLETECQKLRGLVRKKLPGAAALAQMKLEVENLGYDHGDSRLQKTQTKSLSPRMMIPGDFSLECTQKCHKDVELLTAQLLMMEEEREMLKQALSKSNSELQESRSTCLKTTSRLRSLEAQVQLLSRQRKVSMSSMDRAAGPFGWKVSKPTSLTSMSEDGIDEDNSCADLWATALISGLAHTRKGKDTDGCKVTTNSTHLELMDDFLEMEQLVRESAKSTSISAATDDVIYQNNQAIICDQDAPRLGADNLIIGTFKGLPSLKQVQTRIYSILDSANGELDPFKTLEEIRKVMDDMKEVLPRNYDQASYGSQNASPKDPGEVFDKSISIVCDKQCVESRKPIDHDLTNAINSILQFVVSLGREARESQGGHEDDSGLGQKIEVFCAVFAKVLSSELELDQLVHSISSILTEFAELGYKILIRTREESSSSDCIDKLTLLENKVHQADEQKERFSGDMSLVSQSNSDSEAPHDNCLVANASPEGDIQQSEKEKMQMELSRCYQNLEEKTIQLEKMEKLLEEIRSELSTSQKSNGLAEIQLKCMTESYGLLESRTHDLEADVNFLQSSIRALETELQEEKQNHEVTIANYKDLQSKCADLEEEIYRQKCPTRSSSSTTDEDKIGQDKEIAAAAEKLAECQETILLLSKQLKSLRPAADPQTPRNDDRQNVSQDLQANVRNASGLMSYEPGIQDMTGSDADDVYSVTVADIPMSPMDPQATRVTNSSPLRTRRQKHRPSRSSSSSSSLSLTPDKPGRGFARFFSRVKAP